MYNNPEVSQLKQRYNVLLEQYQRLQGTIKVLRATTDELSSNMKKTEEERDKYKKAFESIFTENIGDAWEQMPDDEKKGMTVDKKLSFFENEINASKLYIRKQMLEKMADIQEENHQLKTELVKLKARLKEKEQQFENAASVSHLGSGVSNSLLDGDDMGPSMKQQPARPVNKSPMKHTTQQDIFDKIGDILGKKAPSLPQEEAEAPKPKASSLASAISQPRQEKEAAQETPAPRDKEKIDTGDIAPSMPTTKFFERLHKMPTEKQQLVVKSLPSLDATLEKIPFAKEILMIIGSTGVYSFTDISQNGQKEGYWGKTSEWKVRKAKDALLAQNFITKGASPKIASGRPQDTFLLTQMGEAWYALKTCKDPIQSLLIQQFKEQKSGPHAILIQKMLAVLNEHGYESYQEVALKTKSTGEMSIADISTNKGEFKNIRIECEMGNYTDQEYVYKFTKALEVSNRLLVGVPTVPIKEKIQHVIEEGLIREKYHGLDNFEKQGLFYKVFTLQELTNNPDLILPPQKKGRR